MSQLRITTNTSDAAYSAGQAIRRSISHNEIAQIHCDTRDSIGIVQAILVDKCDDWTESGEVTEYWGEAHGEQWRVHVTASRAARLTDGEIGDLRVEAAEAGDEDMMEICDDALAGIDTARDQCAAAIESAEAMLD